MINYTIYFTCLLITASTIACQESAHQELKAGADGSIAQTSEPFALDTARVEVLVAKLLIAIDRMRGCGTELAEITLEIDDHGEDAWALAAALLGDDELARALQRDAREMKLTAREAILAHQEHVDAAQQALAADAAPQRR